MKKERKEKYNTNKFQESAFSNNFPHMSYSEFSINNRYFQNNLLKDIPL